MWNKAWLLSSRLRFAVRTSTVSFASHKHPSYFCRWTDSVETCLLLALFFFSVSCFQTILHWNFLQTRRRNAWPILVILNLYSDRTVEKIVHYFLNTQRIFMRWSAYTFVSNKRALRCFVLTRCSFLQLSRAETEPRVFARSCVYKYRVHGHIA